MPRTNQTVQLNHSQIQDFSSLAADNSFLISWNNKPFWTSVPTVRPVSSRDGLCSFPDRHDLQSLLSDRLSADSSSVNHSVLMEASKFVAGSDVPAINFNIILVTFSNHQFIIDHFIMII